MSVLPTRLAMASTAAVSRASSLATSAMPSLFSEAMPFSSMSVANTLAPSRANASAQARPMPAAAAVTKARLPLRRSDMGVSLFRSPSTILVSFKKDVDARHKAGHDDVFGGSAPLNDYPSPPR